MQAKTDGQTDKQTQQIVEEIEYDGNKKAAGTFVQ